MFKDLHTSNYISPQKKLEYMQIVPDETADVVDVVYVNM
jgi:hypothetical protein